MNFERLYNGVNVSEFLVNLTKLESLSNQMENYDTLLKTSQAIQRSFSGAYLHRCMRKFFTVF